MIPRRQAWPPAHELEAWPRTLLEAGMVGLKRRHGDLGGNTRNQVAESEGGQPLFVKSCSHAEGEQ